MKSVLSVFAVMALSVLLSACGNKGNTDVIPMTPMQTQSVSTANYFYFYKGQCYSDGNQQVHSRYCEGLTGYYQVNGYCYNPKNSRVDRDYCAKVPLRVHPVCKGASYYSYRSGKKSYLKCDSRGCMGKRVYDRNDRLILCRS